MPHRPSDYPSFLLYVLDETHVTVTAVTAIAIAYTQDAHAAWFGAGALGSTLMARCIKHMIRQPRPPPPPPESKPAPVRPKRTFGMPSTHSTALAFYLFYLWPLLPLISGATWLERGVVTAITAMGLWSRIELGYHTKAQVAGGAAVGAVCAYGWLAVWKAYPAIGLHLQAAIDDLRLVVTSRL